MRPPRHAPARHAHHPEASPLRTCQIACQRCGAAFLARARGGASALRCVRLMLEAADLCGTVLALTEHDRAAKELASYAGACINVCERCAREIERAGFAWAAECGDLCQRAAEACRAFTTRPAV